MAVGDAVGAPLEFTQVTNGDGVTDPNHHFSLAGMDYKGELNRFRLKVLFDNYMLDVAVRRFFHASSPPYQA